MEAIKETLQNVIKALEQRKSELPRDDPEALLNRSLGKKELRHVRFDYFKKGILNISVDSSSWLYNLNLQKEGLLARLRQQSGAIKDIRFRIGNTQDTP